MFTMKTLTCLALGFALMTFGCGGSKESADVDPTSSTAPDATAQTPATETASNWFATHGVEEYPNLTNAHEMPWPNDEGKKISSLNATTADSNEQVLAFYKSKYADAKGEQSATAYGIGATTAGGKQLIIMLVPAGKDLTALQFLLEE